MREINSKAGPGDIPAPQNLPPDVIPQERITGDMLHGHGPRRGNLERLLRYWRPIMRKEGGFRRCRVILADHPELFPLNNMCAWLHHETTGLWPNEGCHHPGMKNCKKKLKKVVNGSLFTDSEFNSHLRSISGGKKSLNQEDESTYDDVVVTNEDIDHAMKVMLDFVAMEKAFTDHISDDSNWEIEGDDTDSGMKTALPYVRSEDAECC